MNLQEALDTANWLVDYAFSDEMSPDDILRVRKMRDVIFYIHAGAGISEIRLDAYDQGLEEAEGGDQHASG